MSPFPLFDFSLVPLRLVLPVAEEVEEFDCGHMEYIVPGASAGLRYRIYIRNPSPLVPKAVSCSSILFRIFSLSVLSLIPFAIRLE